MKCKKRSAIISLLISDYNKDYEIVIVEDGSALTCSNEIDNFKDKLN